jgi:hypothetical protein
VRSLWGTDLQNNLFLKGDTGHMGTDISGNRLEFCFSKRNATEKNVILVFLGAKQFEISLDAPKKSIIKLILKYISLGHQFES